MLPSINTFIFSKIERSYFFCTFIKNKGLMKTNHFGILFILLLSIGACKKKENAPVTNNPSSTNVFRLKNNGVLFTTNNPGVSTNQTMIGINAGVISETGTSYQLGIKKNLLPGTYPYTGSIDDPLTFTIISDQLIYVENHGSITVLSNDTVLKKIVFNFEFEMLEDNSHSDTLQITEGSATISY